MQTIFVMVKCDLGKAYTVADAAIQGIEQISEVHSISGQYDLMMKCYLNDAVDIGHFVTEAVQPCPVSRTPSPSSPSRPLPEGPAAPQ